MDSIYTSIWYNSSPWAVLCTLADQETGLITISSTPPAGRLFDTRASWHMLILAFRRIVYTLQYLMARSSGLTREGFFQYRSVF